MQRNESIIAVPTTVEQPGQTRQFLVRLVERLDIIIGTRGGDPYVSNSQLKQTTLNGLTALEKTVLEVVQRLLTAGDQVTGELLEGIATSTGEAIDELKSSDTIANGNTNVQTISDPPTQAQVQALASQISANAITYNTLLIALRGTGIIAT